MLRYIIFFLSLMALFTDAAAQEKIKISGKVADQKTHEPVPFVHVIDKFSGNGTATDVNGAFSIAINLGDTLIFSAVGYSKHTIVVTRQATEVYLDIQLNPETMELKAVNVFAYRDLASLKKAIVEMDVPAKEEKRFFNIPVKAASNGTGLTINGGITGLINAVGLNKRYNQLQKLEKHKEIALRSQQVRQKYNIETIKEWTDLQEYKIASFIEFCKLSDDFIIAASEYDLVVAVNHCLEEFKKVND